MIFFKIPLHSPPLTETFFSQALFLKEGEKTLLTEKVSSLQAELSAAALETERVYREAALYKEQEQVTGLWSEFILCRPVSRQLAYKNVKHFKTFCLIFSDQSEFSEH